MNGFSFFGPAACALVLIAGCGPSPVVPAEGTIRFKGVALDGASVIVQYPDGNVAQDVSHDGGKFALTYNGMLGALPGTKLRVCVRKAAALYSAPPRSGSSPPDPAVRTDDADIAIMSSGTVVAAKSGTKVSAPPPEVDAQCELTIPAGGSKALKIELP